MNQDLNLAISETFTLLEAVCVNFPKSDLKAKAIQVWKAVLESEQVGPDDLREATVKWLKTQKFMPAPSEILALVREVRPAFVINDPVVVLTGDGEVRLGSRALCMARGLEFVELSRETVGELPALRHDARSRLLGELDEIAREKAV